MDKIRPYNKPEWHSLGYLIFDNMSVFKQPFYNRRLPGAKGTYVQFQKFLFSIFDWSQFNYGNGSVGQVKQFTDDKPKQNSVSIKWLAVTSAITCMRVCKKSFIRASGYTEEGHADVMLAKPKPPTG